MQSYWKESQKKVISQINYEKECNGQTHYKTNHKLNTPKNPAIKQVEIKKEYNSEYEFQLYVISKLKEMGHRVIVVPISNLLFQNVQPDIISIKDDIIHISELKLKRGSLQSAIGQVLTQKYQYIRQEQLHQLNIISHLIKNQ